ncbi:NAD(P)/FAD-dependent oxidoreductase [Paludibaculum fermentans]|uniref:NAD(P)/FAD-dependent oxidoreductase n=1 Tax=Paludibaculum fermentans TaxID=1473598 RepID=A0A7S7NVE2_PALFE|nr:NAD(P)/FAD-dependent oxidoreductase [Paludibaculum fermentans]QOY90499.1 NAD(P)/FAD-dependent oxidoreductase [Paludibaculum fermentans]
MKRVAVLGGGPAGSMAAAGIAAAGLDTILLDEKLAWEKPCGGGITFKAYTRYPFLLENDRPKKVVSDAVLTEPSSGSVQMGLTQPLVIFSRYDLNGLLLKRAEDAGVQIEQDRVTGLERKGSGWSIKTRAGALDADFVVVATGARNALRNVGTEWSAADTMYALGYWVPDERSRIDIQFFPNFEGYIWVFPRCGHLSVGICGKGESAPKMRARLEQYMLDNGIPLKDAKFYGHMIPALERPSWRSNRVSGEGWMAVGDAAGLVDPVTGEGLYYAFRSGDLAAQSILNEQHDPAQRPALYRSLIHGEFMEDLTLGAGLAKRFFIQRIMFSSVPARMIELMRRSPRMMEIVQDLFSGTQGYLDLKARLLANLNGTFLEVCIGSMLGHRVVKEGR